MGAIMKYYKVWAKHEIRVCYLVPEDLIEKGNDDDGVAEEDGLLELLCGKDIAYVEPHTQRVVFDEHYMDKKGIKLVVEDIDGDPSPTLFPRMTADWDIGFPDEELGSDSDSSEDDSDVDF